MRVVKRQHELPREVGVAPSMESPKVKLDGALSDLGRVKMSLLMAGGWPGWGQGWEQGWGRSQGWGWGQGWS